MENTGFEVTAGGVALVATTTFILYILANFLLAIGVHHDVVRRSRNRLETQFGGPWTWAFATFALGFVALGGYWVIHYSRLARLPSSPKPLPLSGPSPGAPSPGG